LIEFQNVSVEYPGPIFGLNGVDLSIGAGEFVFLVGQTGSGKSTLLKLLIRELVASRGRVLIEGRDLSTVTEAGIPALRRQIGFVPQEIGLLPQKKVYENLMYAMRAAGHTRREARTRVPDLLDRFGLILRSDAYPRELSGGEQQRIAIARALVNNPKLLVADEPTGHLDPETSLDIIGVLEQVNTRGTTVIMATHDFQTIQAFQRRVVRLENGRVVSDAFGVGAGDA
jgi:cell division transport system ATP-binding protein